MSLWSEFLTHNGRIVHKWKHYFPIYETHFRRYINRPVRVIEIGCGEGGSLQMWKRYFGPNAMILGIDIESACAAFEEDQISVRIGDQADAQFLRNVIASFGTPDIIIDDGSHVMSHVVASFRCLYPLLSETGVYLVEDMHTAYWDEYGGGLRRDGTFIELSKALIDELNADHSRGVLPPTEFTRSTQSIHFYDSVVVFERGWTTAKAAPKTGIPGQPGDG